MRKLTILLCATMVAGALSAFAQGRVQIGNGPSKRIFEPGGTTNAAAGAAAGYNVAVYFTTTEPPSGSVAPWAVLNLNPLMAGTTDSQMFVTGTGPTAGLIIPRPGQSATRTITDVAGGTTVWMQLRAWSGSAASWDEAIALPTTIAGVSPLAQVKLAGPTDPVPQLAALLPTGFAVEPVPEPSTLLLGVAGLFGLYLIRRRK